MERPSYSSDENSSTGSVELDFRRSRSWSLTRHHDVGAHESERRQHVHDALCGVALAAVALLILTLLNIVFGGPWPQ